MAQAQILTDSQLKRALARCDTRKHRVRDQAIIQISVYAGLRAKEIAALTWGMLFESTGAVRPQFNLQGSQSKHGRSRTVYVSRKLRRVLEQYRSTAQDPSPNQPLFLSQRQQAFSANTMCQLMLDIYKSAGLASASSHSGRRTFITRLAEQGINVRLLAELAGHSSITTTQRYIDVSPQQLARAVELV